MNDQDLARWRLTRLAGELVRFRLGGNERIGRVVADDYAVVFVRLWINSSREWDLQTGRRQGAQILRGRILPVAPDDKRRRLIEEDDMRRQKALHAVFGPKDDRAPSLQNLPALQNPSAASLAIRETMTGLMKQALVDALKNIDYGPTERRLLKYNECDVALTLDLTKNLYGDD